MDYEKMNVGKSISCDMCVAKNNGTLCRSLPPCAGTDYNGEFFNVVFVKQTAMGVALEGAK